MDFTKKMSRKLHQEHIKKYALNFPFSNNPPQIHIDMHISPHHDLFFRVGTLPGLNPPKSPTSMATGYRWIVSP